MEIFSCRMLVSIVVIASVLTPGTDAWWRRRRRRSAPAPVPVDRTAPKFNEACPINLGVMLTSSVPKTVTWTEPTATDTGSPTSPPVTVERYGAGPGSAFSEGDHFITYQARDTVPNYSTCRVYFSIRLIQCAGLRHIQNGYLSCTEGSRVNSLCRYICFQGYTLSGGTQSRVCNEQNGQASWSGSEPTCVEWTCPAAVASSAPENGQVACSNGNTFQSVCSYSCSPGFSIPPGQSRDRVCTTAGWTGTQPECQDTSAPGFEDCPLSQIIYAEDGQESAIAAWTAPTATDNSGGSISDVTLSGPSPGSPLPQGHYVVTYTAQDEEGNEGRCTFTITVQVIHCSTLPINPGLIVSCNYGNLRGSTCSFTCSHGYSLQGPETTQCERSGFSGTWTNQPPVCEELVCPEIEAPENGAFLNGYECSRTYGTSCYFECLSGFKINNNILRCFASPGGTEAFWEGDVPLCEVETCERPSLSGPLEVADNSSVCWTEVQIPAGEECEFDCGLGYSIQGLPQATCGLSGSWEQTLPTCEVVRCLGSNLPPPEHGGKSGCPHEEESFGAVCTLFCDVGYEASEAGPVRRVCEADGEGGGVWSGGPIACSVVQCLPLDIPANGYLDSCHLAPPGSEGGAPITSDPTLRQDYGTTCAAHCNQGYTPHGTTTRRCLADGRWDGTEQTCIDVTAPLLHCPADVVVYAESGQSQGIIQWEQLEPIQASDAGATLVAVLESIDSEAVSGSRPTALAEGEHTLVYRATDESGNTDTCSFSLQVKVVRCPTLYAPSHGHVTLLLGQGPCEGGAVLGSSCQIGCDVGYNLDHEETAVELTCSRQDEGTTVGAWNGSVPLCFNVRCAVSPSANSSAFGCPFGEVLYGDQCDFVCNDGFSSADGTQRVTRTCGSDGQFDGEALVCDSVVTCPSGFDLQHGTVLPAECSDADTRLSYDTVCTFHCNDGFWQYGPFVRTCLADGAWSDNRLVFCEDRQAPTFDEPCPRYVSVNADRGKLTSTVDFAIPTATDNSGNVTVSKVDNFAGPGSLFSEGTTTTYYTATDHRGNAATCQINIDINVFRCPQPQAPARGSLVNCSDPIYGSSCSFACNHGYQLTGPATRVCELTGGQAPANWDGEQPSCQPRTCPALETSPLVVRSGCLQNPPGVELFGTLCTYYCPYGYAGVGESLALCQADGTWSSTNFSCEATACSPLTAPSGGSIMPADCLTDPRFGETCLLTCETSGFQVQPVTLSHAVCLGSGQWSKDMSTAACVDIEEPVFTECPGDFLVYAPEGQVQAEVSWTVAAVDNDPTADINVSCDTAQGLKSQGDYLVTCLATDPSQNVQTCSFEVSVRERRCPPLAPPVFGHVMGSCDTLWGSECEVGCEIGYTLEGPSRTLCNFTGLVMQWERETVPFCDIVGCDPIELPEDSGINVYPTSCTNLEKVYYGTECSFFCRDGLTVEGDITSVSCDAGGQWSSNVSSLQLSCRDEVAPILTFCPGPQSVIRTEVWGAEVTFDLPTATDNTDSVLSVTSEPANLTSPSNFTEDAMVSFTFSDSSGNTVTCSFAIYVQDEIPPQIVFCPPDLLVNTSEVLTTVSWDPPIFHEVTGDALLITSNYDDHSATFPWGTHVVTYVATNTDNGKSVGCDFSVEIMPVTCKDLSVPHNGALSCDEWAYGRFCSIFCNANFDVPRLPPAMSVPTQYVCGSSGLWNPHAYVPDCSEVRRPTRSNLPSELLYFTGSCSTQETRDEIANAFLQILLSTDFSEICTASDECTIENVRVICGPALARRRRRHDNIDAEWLLSSGRMEQRKRKRRRREGEGGDVDVENARAKRSTDAPFLLAIEWDFVSNVNQDPALDNFGATIEAEDTMIEMAEVLDTQIKAGTFSDFSNIPGVNLTLDQDSLTYGYAEVICGHGYTADNDDLHCVPCVAGTFYDNATMVCQPCPRGSYQDSDGQSSCIPCDPGTWTEHEGAINVTQCKDICDAGFFSSSGVVLCHSCPVGTYQPSSLATSCLQCPNGTTTEAPASTAIQQCMAPCPPGSSSISGFVPCEECPLSHYQSLSQQKACIPCPDHLSTITTAAVSVEECMDIDECLSDPCDNGATCVDLLRSYQCNCVAGYEGENCELLIDNCSSLPCLHAATCHVYANGYSCSCLPGYTGADCEVPFDLCQAFPCANNSTCFSLATHYECHCLPGYHGTHCELELHACSPSPCLNDAVCRVLSLGEGAYECDCQAGFSGVNCSRDIDECHSHPCLHGGMCVDGIDGFHCTCANGYNGLMCATDIDLCESSPCSNNGTCVDLGHTVECLCQQGYAGDWCERESNACDDEPCQNGGTCTAIEDSSTSQTYTCACSAGFIGRDCEVDWDECASSPCSNGATCVEGQNQFTCNCTQGSTGLTCEDIVDWCLENPCSTDATCVDNGRGSYQCLCPPGWSGEACSDPIDFCEEAEQCLNGATCINEAEAFSCQCITGFQGSKCEVEINECASEPCLHGSTCTDLIGKMSCQCLSGYTGTFCEEDIDECLSGPCVNGTCQDGVDAFSCDCNHGYTGLHCDMPVDFCSNQPCLNNGVCTNSQDGFRCTCLSGFTGLTCETDIDECLSYPCFSGNCVDEVDGYTCVCDQGLNGLHCEADVNECATKPCLNNGTCLDRVGKYSCQCGPGFDGDNCEVDIDECASSPCYHNATCQDGVASFTCRCPPQFSGALCQLEATLACASHPCKNGGACEEGQEEGVAFVCSCLVGYTGEQCEVDIDECNVAAASCENGATCVDQVNGFICLCPPGYEGTLCQLSIDECAPHPCLNGATCVDGVASFSCQCADGFAGILCDVNIDECSSSPCQNLGSCEDGVNGYICHCAAGFTGLKCDAALLECSSNPCLNGATCSDGFLQFTCACSPGFTGTLCDTALATDFDFILGDPSEVIQVANITPSDPGHMTFTSWLQASDAPPDFLVFGFFIGDEEYSLSNPCSLQLTIHSIVYDVQLSLCDGAWHHVSLRLTFDTELVWALEVDQAEPLSRNVTMATSDLRQEGGVIRLGSSTMRPADYVVMSAYNVWNLFLPDDDMMELSTSCDTALFGDLVAWPVLVSEITSANEMLTLQSPSGCDAVNECSSSPCIHGSCENKLGSFHCECEPGYNGERCEHALDICPIDICKNGGICRTVEGKPLCQCPDRFSGDFCEMEIVDGGWSGWSLWSECSVSCAGGSRTRSRQCTDPAPQGGGDNCTGNAESQEPCNEYPCPGCKTLRRPYRGYLDCTKTEDLETCTISCRHGYGFAEKILVKYECGELTNYRWSHETEDNPLARFPACTELVPNAGGTGVVTIGYPGAVCTSADDKLSLESAAYQSLMSHSNSIDCLQDGTCKVTTIQVDNCQLQTLRRRSVRAAGDVMISYVVTQNATDVEDLEEYENGTQPLAVQPLDVFYYNFTALLGNGSLVLEVSDQLLHSSPNLTAADAWENCPMGYLESTTQGFCVPCGRGSYFGRQSMEMEYECLPCPQNTYQDQEGQDDCILCPGGTITNGMHALNVSECTAEVDTPTTPPPYPPVSKSPSQSLPLPIIIGSAAGALLILLFIIIIISICVYKKGGEVKNDTSMIANADRIRAEGNPYNYVYNGDGAYNDNRVDPGNDQLVNHENRGFLLVEGAEGCAMPFLEKPQALELVDLCPEGAPPPYAGPRHLAPLEDRGTLGYLRSDPSEQTTFMVEKKKLPEIGN